MRKSRERATDRHRQLHDLCLYPACMSELSGKIWMRVTDRRSPRSEEVLVGADAPSIARHEKLLHLEAHVLFDPAADTGRGERRGEGARIHECRGREFDTQNFTRRSACTESVRVCRALRRTDAQDERAKMRIRRWRRRRRRRGRQRCLPMYG